jgi:hypothetical protein
MAVTSTRQSGIIASRRSVRDAGEIAADFSNVATGTYTEGGVLYKYLTFTGNGSLAVTRAGVADILVIGGGGGGGGEGGGGAGGYLEVANAYFSVGAVTVVVGAGGVRFQDLATDLAPTNGITSRLGNYYAVGGGAGGVFSGMAQQGQNGGSGGGGAFGATSGGSGTSGQGNDGESRSSGAGGGGAGEAGGTDGMRAGGDGLASALTGTDRKSVV